MKVLYVKNGNNRVKRFQLQTMIYEIDGKKFVKKSALCEEALVHLHKMKENYMNLSKVIINPQVKLAQIVDEDERSITFEYIEGKSLAKRFQEIRLDKEKVRIFIAEYSTFIKNAFKTIQFDAKNISNECKEVFGHFDYSILDGTLCFEGYSNIDLVFSNIIYQDDKIYIIDYEWVFPCSFPVDYTIYRSLRNNELLHENDDLKIYQNIDFIESYVFKQSFHKYKVQYLKKNSTIDGVIQEAAAKLMKKELLIQEQIQILGEKEAEIENLVTSNKELLKLANSMRIKNRIKKFFGLYYDR